MTALLIASAGRVPVAPDPELMNGASREDHAGWVIAHLKGTPTQIGYQHGYLLGPEINDVLAGIKLSISHAEKGDAKSNYEFDKVTAHAVCWGGVPQELREEIAGIARGVRDRGYHVDTDDILLINAGADLGYYTDELLNRRKKGAPVSHAGDHCSAFVATGSATKDGKIVMGHNCWTDYLNGERANSILDITPLNGNRILMDSTPGIVDSGDDFGINSAGILLTETTISEFHGFDEKGIPEFVRMREAMQYANSIEDVARIFRTQNNGAYANMWLIGDVKTNEIAKLELGLKYTPLTKSKDGVFYSANYPEDPKLSAEECATDTKLGENPCADRKKRWEVLVNETKGKIDAKVGKAFLSDHFDQVHAKSGPSLSCLCGHGENDARPNYGGGDNGATSGKVVTSDMANHLEFWARMGHPCGIPFVAADYLNSHKDDAWQKPLLRDMPSVPWIVVKRKN